jgi:CBS domain-containing membrane protein
MRPKYKNLLKHYSFYLGGDQPHVLWVERIRSVLGAFIGLMLALTTAKYLGELSGLDEWLMASLGGGKCFASFCLAAEPYGPALGGDCRQYPIRFNRYRNDSFG